MADANLTILSSMLGQYLTPVPVIFPPYRADLGSPDLIISCVFAVVCVSQHGSSGNVPRGTKDLAVLFEPLNTLNTLKF